MKKICHFPLLSKYSSSGFGAGMHRREFVRLMSSTAAAWPFVARAQQPAKIYRIAVTSPSAPVSVMSETGSVYGPFFKELRRLGYIEGKNTVVLRFSAEQDTARYDPMVRDVVGASPDVIFTSNNPLVLRFKALVHTIPIVALMGDPVAFGIVASLASPEGNITGISADAGEDIWGKRLELLLEAVPTSTRIGFLCSEPFWEGPQGAKVREAARRFSVTLIAPPLKGVYKEPEYLRVFGVLNREHVQALLVSDGVENNVQHNLIVRLVAKQHLPALYPYRSFVDVGGLMAYAVDVSDMFRRGADYVDMILKGKKPDQIPIYQADRFTTIINLKSAKALGITVPPSLLARADEVIE